MGCHGYHVVAVWAGAEEGCAADQGERTLHLLPPPPGAPKADGGQLGEAASGSQHQMIGHRLAGHRSRNWKLGYRTGNQLTVMWRVTLRASLSSIFLQTLPDLVTPLKGHSLSPCSCPPTRSVPSKRFGY